RWTSPLESASVLPCSEERSLASASNSQCRSSRNLNITRARRCGLVAAQAGCAVAALATAAATSARLAKATLAWISPVLGLNTSPKRPDAPATCLPPMKWPISRMRRLPDILACLLATGIGLGMAKGQRLDYLFVETEEQLGWYGASLPRGLRLRERSSAPGCSATPRWRSLPASRPSPITRAPTGKRSWR